LIGGRSVVRRRRRRRRRKGDHGGAVRERRNDRNLGVDEDVHDAEVEFVVGVVGFTERGFAVRFSVTSIGAQTVSEQHTVHFFIETQNTGGR
jgi:hypothetical protein